MGPTTELLIFIVSSLLLLISGELDRRYRLIHPAPLLVLLGIGIVATGYKLLKGGIHLATVTLSVFAAGVVSVGLVVILVTTSMIGLGDILAILASTLATPTIPVGRLTMIPGPSLIAALIASIILYINMRRMCEYRPDFPKEYRYVIKTYAGNLKRMRVLTMYPVVIDGKPVYEEVFSGNPARNSKRILSRVSDDAVVYAVPNFPFVYYYALSYIGVYGIGIALSLLLSVLGV